MRTSVTKFLIPLLIVLMSCGGDDPSQDSPVPEPEGEHCLLQKQITPSLTLTITRDNAGLPTVINYDYKVGTTEFKTAANMEYDASGKLTKIQGQDYSFTFEYNSTRQKSREIMDGLTSSATTRRIITGTLRQTQQDRNSTPRHQKTIRLTTQGLRS